MTTQPPPRADGDRGGEQPPDQASAEWKPVDASAPAPHHPPLPRAVKIGGLAGLGVLLVAAILLGVALGGGFGDPEHTPSASASPALNMELPVQVGDYVRGDITTSQGPAPDNKRIARADYSDGEHSVVVLLTFPETDLPDFLSAAGVETDQASQSASPSPSASVVLPPDVLCGPSLDTGKQACGRIVDNTGLLVATVTEQDEQAVEKLLEEFQQAVTP